MKTSMAEMLKQAAAKKAQMGAPDFAQPHEENTVPKLPPVCMPHHRLELC